MKGLMEKKRTVIVWSVLIITVVLLVVARWFVDDTTPTVDPADASATGVPDTGLSTSALRQQTPPGVNRPLDRQPSRPVFPGANDLADLHGPSHDLRDAQAQLAQIRAELAQTTDPDRIEQLKRNERVVSRMVERLQQFRRPR